MVIDEVFTKYESISIAPHKKHHSTVRATPRQNSHNLNEIRSPPPPPHSPIEVLIALPAICSIEVFDPEKNTGRSELTQLNTPDFQIRQQRIKMRQQPAHVQCIRKQ